MFFVRVGSVAVLIAVLSPSLLLAAHTHRSPTSGHARSSSRKQKTAPPKTRGQRGIDPDRAKEIQSALIREKYLTGEPSGQWDSATESAMQRYQADHGWQTKLTPDSRALIKLGLGPNHSPDGSTPVNTQVSPSASAAGSEGAASMNTSALY
jgi:Putative peptidoglycan binding domain